jgi:signal peptidase I
MKLTKRAINPFRDAISLIVIAFLFSLFMQFILVQAFRIPSASMMNTLQVGDFVLANKFIYWFHPPQRYDVIVFMDPEEPRHYLIKRVIALPGETIKIKDNMVYIDDKPIPEPYLSDPTYDQGSITSPTTIPEGQIFVMGDNRNVSRDSRFIGTIDISTVKGKAFAIFWNARNRKGQMIDYPWYKLFRLQPIA